MGRRSPADPVSLKLFYRVSRVAGRARLVCQHALMSLAALTACSRLTVQQPFGHSGLGPVLLRRMQHLDNLCVARIARYLRRRIVSAASPLIDPDRTLAPGAFAIRNGSPVRYDSSILPCPLTTTPSTGQISCG
jgi:hypothetical protein